ncbi:homoserine O-acetyltransferase MetA [Virgibacillus pantothenticus]|uniref:Homoserine O-acetyltransferase n=1 Tax=Virgibacillus pantothenticus TaxID=1473 RepID=A0A0L0QRG8_VIRPA|nr:homoserine O-succinyltransferase [Virgibacillus pantothenticus]KNE21225.1 homoserine O-succinyltransferase [Virgibacillus pantothenticus]MED3737065.1 homoserine O-succinyltransferase [Virgibacillus pantothenticus]QTY16365.1 homoserine O-succinyltransferase [Virgibacillus pantothenticus]SIS68327.1 homoserine O-succinyltransferase [Virgibacillus pantothenticus]
MPITIPRQLPAHGILEKENVFIMDTVRATTQDIRPLNIVIVNLMPEKERTETQLLRLLGNSPLQVLVTFLRTATHDSKTVSKSHLNQFYQTFHAIKHKRFDGMIITGAPVELMSFEEVNYWEELKLIMEWSKTHVTSVMHICWAAQAALYHHYGIGKFTLPTKCTGVFPHSVSHSTVELIRGFDDEFLAPHSRYTGTSLAAIQADDRLMVLAATNNDDPFIVISKDEKHIMITGHFEYDHDTLAKEYQRDKKKGLDPVIPKNYFANDDTKKTPLNRWRSHAHLLFSNWLNYYVYQETPYEWK